jgi:hypothetical protein
VLHREMKAGENLAAVEDIVRGGWLDFSIMWAT